MSALPVLNYRYLRIVFLDWNRSALGGLRLIHIYITNVYDNGNSQLLFNDFNQ